MIYVLQLFLDATDDRESRQVTVTKHRAKSTALAEAHARLLIAEAKADVCLIKDQAGKLLGEVRSETARNRDATLEDVYSPTAQGVDRLPNIDDCGVVLSAFHGDYSI